MAKSKNDVMYYMSKMTGEVVETHAEAMELYRAGHDIACYGWSERLQGVVNKLDWEHWAQSTFYFFGGASAAQAHRICV